MMDAMKKDYQATWMRLVDELKDPYEPMLSKIELDESNPILRVKKGYDRKKSEPGDEGSSHNVPTWSRSSKLPGNCSK